MKKINVIYLSNTGNTEAMAEAVVSGAEGDGVEVKLINFDSASEEDVLSADAVALGCPACGTEELDEDYVVPLLDAIGDKIKDKPVALFGSYGWGGGDYMEEWEDKMKEMGANLVCDSVVAEESPDDDAIEACKALGASLK